MTELEIICEQADIHCTWTIHDTLVIVEWTQEGRTSTDITTWSAAQLRKHIGR